MPEQISKYPDVTLQVLRESSAVCGQGAPQNILKQCPRDRFCLEPPAGRTGQGIDLGKERCKIGAI